MVTFISIFATQFIDVANRVEISATTSTSDDMSSTNSIENLQFAIALAGVQLGGNSRYFSFTL